METEKFAFRLATLADVPALHALVNGAYRGDGSRAGWTTEAELLDGQRIDPEGLREILGSGNQVLLLMSRGARLIGCVLLRRHGGHAYLGMLTIDPHAQNGGLGRALLAEAEAYARREWKSPRMEMRVFPQRAPLIAWYERRGYRLTDRTEPFPYGDPRFGLPKRDDLRFVVLEKDL
jgi:ribosomal protein S18 acetylase RimI-like enzyme